MSSHDLTHSTAPEASRVDPIAFSLALNRLNSIAREMTVVVEKAAFTTMLSLVGDYSCCVYDAAARQIAMVDAIPIHTNSLHLTLEEIMRTFAEDIRDGDVLMCNAPFRRNTHIGDLVTACPVFWEGRHMFWCVVRGHQLDVGAPVPISSNAAAATVWQEGVHVPPVKIYDGGELRRDVLDYYLSNLRWRESLEGDLMAQLGSIWTGRRRLEEMCKEFGNEDLVVYLDEAIAYGERRTSQEIASMPNGTYQAEGWLDTDGAEEIDSRICASVTISDDMIDVDFAGSAGQGARAMNSTFACMQAAAGIPVAMAISPDIPHNEGCLRRITASAPPGSICNANYPAATALATTTPTDLMQDTVFKALAQAIPDRIRAGQARWGGCAPMLSGVDQHGVHWGHMLMSGGGGGGAAHGADGWPLMITPAASGALKVASIEHTELLFPLLFDQWELEPDSMGFGEWIGGPGVRCTLRSLSGPVTLLYVSDGLTNPPYGVLGGTPGAGGGAYFQDDRTRRRRFLHSAIEPIDLMPGETWTGISSGGGGFGNPLRRPIAQVARDVRDGLYGRETARDVYGVALDTDGSLLDEETAKLRSEIGRRQDTNGLPVALPEVAGSSTWFQKRMAADDRFIGVDGVEYADFAHGWPPKGAASAG